MKALKCTLQGFFNLFNIEKKCIIVFLKTEMGNYQILIQKLDEFIRKYYINILWRGLLLTVALLAFAFVVINLLESYFYFGTTIRKIFFWSFNLITIAVMFKWIIVPLLHLLRIGKVINHEEAARIIGKHFANVQDKLLNILQLKNHPLNYGNQILIEASINQKIENIKLVPFTSAIDVSNNKKYVRYALAPLISIILLLTFFPSLIKESTKRLIQNNTVFEKPAPFQFNFLNKNQKAIQYQDFEVVLQTQGKSLPNEVFVEVEGYEYKMTKINETKFSYTIPNISKNTNIRFAGGGFTSSKYEINVLQKPSVEAFEINVDYPDYTGKKDETLNNIGDLVVPTGTNLKWNITTKHTDNVSLKIQDKMKNADESKDDFFAFSHRFLNDASYSIFYSNKSMENVDSANYNIVVIPDEIPTIQVQNKSDSLDKNIQYYAGEAADDYGINSVLLKYAISNAENNKTPVFQTKKLSFTGIKNRVQFSYIFDLKTFNLQPSESLQYYFETWDNDAVHGSKSARTQQFFYKKPSIKDAENQIKEKSEDILKQLEAALKDAEKLKDKAKEIQQSLIEKKQLDFQDKQKIQDLAEKQAEIEKQFNEAQKKLEEKLNQEKELGKEKTDEIKKKEEQLQQMMKENMNKEMQELMQKIQELMQQLDKKEQAIEQVEKMEQSQENANKQMERLKELYKQLEVEKMMDDVIKKMDELADKQEKLAEEAQKENANADKLKEEQEKISKAFDDLKKDMKELQQKNEDLKNKKEIPDSEAEQQAISEDQEQAEENLEQNEPQKAGKNQNKAASKMKQLAKKMKAAKQKNAKEQHVEDMKTLRQILENLITISYDEENLIELTQNTITNQPQFNSITQKQFKLKDDFKIVKDSLEALSQRVFELQTFINDKVNDINGGFKKTIKLMEEKNARNAAIQQQYLMTWMNDLALMLSEALEQMQNNAAMQMPGDQMCQNPGNKPGKGAKPGKSGSGMQQQLNDKIEQMSGKPNKDGRPGLDGKPKSGNQGQGGQNGQGGSESQNNGKPGSKDFAEMAQMQQAIRQALQEMKNKMGNDGKTQGKSELQRLIDDMSRTEEDLYNKRITNEMLQRQKDILTRLLQHENAQRQQQQDDERESKTPQNIARKLPAELENYLKQRKAETDKYKNIPPNLKPYYKKLVEQYFNAFQD